MKTVFTTKTVFTAFLAAGLIFCSCGDANQPVQTASEHDSSGEDSAGASSGAGATTNKKDSTINNAGKKNLPDQMVPENSSATPLPSTTPNQKN